MYGDWNLRGETMTFCGFSVGMDWRGTLLESAKDGRVVGGFGSVSWYLCRVGIRDLFLLQDSLDSIDKTLHPCGVTWKYLNVIKKQC